MESDGAVFAGLSAVVGMSRFFGSLSIRSRSITFESRGKLNEFMTAETRQTVVHSERRVVVVRGRLHPPNLNSSVILRGESASGGAITAGVQMPAGVRRKVISALRAAGFEVAERTTWSKLGGGGSEWELGRR